jgi:hypothetical protein
MDDLSILQMIQHKLGFGKIHFQKDNRVGQNPCYRLEINSKEGCKYICDLFSTFPHRAKKARDFLLWKEAVSKWSNVVNGNSSKCEINNLIWETLAQMKSELKEIRRMKEVMS